MNELDLQSLISVDNLNKFDSLWINLSVLNICYWL